MNYRPLPNSVGLIGAGARSSPQSSRFPLVKPRGRGRLAEWSVTSQASQDTIWLTKCFRNMLDTATLPAGSPIGRPESPVSSQHHHPIALTYPRYLICLSAYLGAMYHMLGHITEYLQIERI